jgi:hypothetical protein
MTRFIPSDIWKVVGQKSKAAGRRRAAIAYVTRDLPLSLQEGDILITDASKHSISSGQTSAPLLRTLFDRGVELFSYGGLHAKLIVLDNIVIVSSANLSDQSVSSRLVEAGLMTDHPGTVAGALSFIEQLKGLSQKLTSKRIETLERIPVVRKGGPAGASAKRRRPKVATRSSSWIASIYEWMKPLKEDEEAEVNEGLELATTMMADPKSEPSWVCYAKRSRFAREIQPGDTVVWIWRTHSSLETPEFVYRHCSVLFCKEGKRHRWLFYEEQTHAEKQRLTWVQFERLCKRIELPYALGINTELRLPDDYSDALHNLWGKSVGK